MQLQFINSLNGTRLGTFLQAIAFITGVPLFQNNINQDGFSRTGSRFRNLDMEGSHPDDPLNTRCYGALGCITAKYTEQRGFHLFPESLQEIKPKICLYVDSLRDNCQLVESDTLETLNISKSHQSFWIVHGYLENAQRPWVQIMVNELLSYNQDYNVMVVDWSRGAEPPYNQAVVNLELEAAYVAHMMLNLQETLGLNVTNSHVIGHSLGAHMSGFIGSWLYSYSGHKLGRISALDPAQPFFENYPEDIRLDSTDAELVDVIHTDAKPLLHGGSITGLGTQEPSGHVDFFPNNGKDQPGCKDGVYQSILQEEGSFLSGLRRFIGCDHIRSYEYFTESIRSPCPFMTFSCPSWNDFISSSCLIQCNHPDGQGNCNKMGFHAKKPQTNELLKPQTWEDGTNVSKPVIGSVVYYSITGNRMPFCREHYQVTLNLAGISVLRSLTDLHLVIFGVKRSVKVLNLGERDLRGSLSYNFIVGGPIMDGPIQRAILKPSSASNPIWWFVSRMAKIPDIEFSSVVITNLEKSLETTLCPEGKSHLTMSDRNPHIFLTTSACALQQVKKTWPLIPI